MSNTEKVKIFISYNSNDETEANRLYESLLQEGYEVWFAPKNLHNKVGQTYTGPIIEGLKQVDFFTILVSSNSVKSNEVESELDAAYHYPKEILPISLEDCNFNGSFVYYIGSKTRVLGERPLRDKDIEQLIQTIESRLKEPKTPNMIRDLVDDYLGRGDGLVKGEKGLTQYCSNMNVTGVGLTHVQDVFVAPTIVRMDTGSHHTGRMAIRAIVDCNEPVYITAEPGFGKSEFCKAIVLDTINQNKELKDTPNETIPFLIEMGREFGGDAEGVTLEKVLLKNLNKYIENYKNMQGVTVLLEKDELKKFMENVNSLIILDGIDEVQNEKVIIKIFEELNQNSLYKNSSIVVASRPGSDVQKYRYRDKEFVNFSVNGFDEIQREAYVRNWAKLSNMSTKKTNTFIKELQKLPDRLKNNPLMLSQLMKIFETKDRLPGKMIEIYEEASNLLVASTCQKLKEEKWDEKFFHGVLCALARRHLVRENIHLESDDVNKAIENFLVEKYGVSADEVELERHRVVSIIESTWLYRNGEFCHKTLNEYYVVKSIFDKLFEGEQMRDASGEASDELLKQYPIDTYNINIYSLIMQKLDAFESSSALVMLVSKLVKKRKIDYMWLITTIRTLTNHQTAGEAVIYSQLLGKMVSGKENIYKLLLFFFSMSKNVEALTIALKNQLKENKDDNDSCKKLFSAVRDLVVLIEDVKNIDGLNNQNLSQSLYDLYEEFEDNSFDSRTVLNELFYNPDTDENKLVKEVINKLDDSDYCCIPDICSIDTYLKIECDKSNRALYQDPCELGLNETLVSGTHAEEDEDLLGLIIITDEKIADYRFYGQSKIAYVIFEGTKEIGEYAFAKDFGLCGVHGANSLERISDRCFFWTKSLKSVGKLENIVEIGNFAFAASGIEEIILPDGLTNLKDGVFYTCSNLKSVKLAESVKAIGYRAFSWCLSLENIDLSHIESIDDSAFTTCSSLKEVVIPPQIKKIGMNIFASCEGLKKINYQSYINIPDNFAIDCTSLEVVEFGDGAEIIGANAFYNCIKLKRIVFPSTLKIIKKEAFMGDYALGQLDLPSEIEQVLARAFRNCEKLPAIDVFSERYPRCYFGVDCFYRK